jgi:hypothetical protein
MSEWTGKHGYSAYANGVCRCDICRTSGTTYQRDLRHRRHAFTKANGLPHWVEHGQSAYSNWGCRCDICKKAQAKKNRDGRIRRKQESAARRTEW